MIPLSPYTPRFTAPRFGALSNSQAYEHEYQGKQHYNGSAPDSFLMQSVRRFFPDADKTSVWDIACGDGRNTIPLARDGYRVTASDICHQALFRVNKERRKRKVRDRVTVDTHDILHPERFRPEQNPGLGQGFHIALMARLSQHLNLAELGLGLKTIYQKLLPGGICIFDSLVRKPGSENFLPVSTDMNEGCMHFKREDIETAIRNAGFTLLETAPFTETGASRPRYVDQPFWGTVSKYGIPPRPVQLQWFVLKKE